MAWDVEYTDEFGAWWATLSGPQQEDVAAHVGELERLGPATTASTTRSSPSPTTSTTCISTS
jgi:hypothetical protein